MYALRSLHAAFFIGCGATVMSLTPAQGAADAGLLQEALVRQCNQQLEPTLVFSVEYDFTEQVTNYELDRRRKEVNQLIEASKTPGFQLRVSTVPGGAGVPAKPEEVQALIKSLQSDTRTVPITVFHCRFVRNEAKYAFITSTMYRDRDGLTSIGDRPPVSYYCDGKLLQVIYPNYRDIFIKSATANPPLEQAKWQEFVTNYRSFPLPAYLSSLQNIAWVDQGDSLVLHATTPSNPQSLLRDDTITFSKALKLPTLIVTKVGPDKLHLRKDTQRIFTYKTNPDGVSLASCEEDNYDANPARPEEIISRKEIKFSVLQRAAPDDALYYAPPIPDNYVVHDEVAGDHFITGDSIQAINRLIQEERGKK